MPSLPRVALLRIRQFWMGVTAPTLFVLSFLVLIAIGTAGLMWIPGLQHGDELSFLDALFTMVSAVCVTGLVVVDTASEFTPLGHLWILAFIQFGGLGLITLTTLVIGALGRRLSLRSEMIVGAPVDIHGRRSVVSLTLSVIRYTFIVETTGAVLLWLLWIPKFGPAKAAWYAVFHSVSAFCNAGFSTFSDSLMSFSQDPLTLVVIAAMIVAGGIGFLTTEEVARWWRERHHKRVRLSVHTTAALEITIALLVFGTAFYAVAEWNGALKSFGLVDRLTNALFLSVTARTAGFNSLDYSQMTNAGVLLTIGLMLVGGNPGSTAGGLKTTTVAVLAALATARVRGRRYTILHGRTVPEGTVQRTVSLVLTAGTLMVVAVFFLGILESIPGDIAADRQTFLPLVFEAVSAFCTVGLSMSLTPLLGDASRLMLILLMFIGRVGPLAFFAAISLRARPEHLEVREAAEDLIVG